MNVMQRKFRVRALLRVCALAWGLQVGAALACPVCAPTSTLTPAQVLINADRALLVRTDPAGALRIDTVIRGPGAAGDRLEWSVPARQMPRRDGKPMLMVRDGLSREWSALAEIDGSHADLLREITQLTRTSEMTAADWQARVARFLPLLEHPEPLIAETAYGEVARSPYSAMRSQRARLDNKRLEQWVNDPALAGRRPLYVLLLGLAGGPAQAELIERQLTSSTRKSDLSDLPALVAADLELRGPTRLPWIEKHLLLDPKRPAAEVQAALVALSVHGADDTTIARERIVETYLRFIAARPPLAGLVAQDLANWQVWEATPAYAALLERADLSIASRVAIAQYLRVSPHPQAKIALQKLAPAAR